MRSIHNGGASANQKIFRFCLCVSKCITSLLLFCGLCLYSQSLCGPLSLGLFCAHCARLMLPKLYDTFRLKVSHSHVVALVSVQWFFLKTVILA